MNPFKINQDSRVLIVGAGHGIGLALVEVLKEHYQVKNIIATYRDEIRATKLLGLTEVDVVQIDPTSEIDIQRLSQMTLTQQLTLVINCVGILKVADGENKTPEKSLRDFNFEGMVDYFRINSMVTPMLAKHLGANLSRKQASVFAALSARVGSLDDNSLGGWHSYRASKAALNMYLRNIAIDFKRSRINCQVFALHPGTVRTELSQDFLKNVSHEIFEPKVAAGKLLAVIQGWSEMGEAQFRDYKGDHIKW